MRFVKRVRALLGRSKNDTAFIDTVEGERWNSVPSDATAPSSWSAWLQEQEPPPPPVSRPRRPTTGESPLPFASTAVPAKPAILGQAEIAQPVIPAQPALGASAVKSQAVSPPTAPRPAEREPARKRRQTRLRVAPPSVSQARSAERSWTDMLKAYGEHLTDEELRLLRSQLG
ncbi:MAG: hypothetical protein H6707_11090 [Deltaproteobacteria bacterium]|nr:hypothetical protein [Deltaproteobacteria bacterium]